MLRSCCSPLPLTFQRAQKARLKKKLSSVQIQTSFSGKTPQTEEKYGTPLIKMMQLFSFIKIIVK